ncbi:carboxypeptidase-like regulatory domain-containing protein [uncultured Cellulomonas sp.]|uniref:carboxypeptidase-like regulatory domain-containing protein n=1 Tax=uncultured Cellulomonas sp. TaxID=189682 RepID=UPI0028ED3A9F|nr:carboxypeptidase-like regulatory domain-containing protein [uncultured Cellulomonas sp.]
MAYEIRGSLWGTLCHDVREPLAGLELRAYRSTGDRTTERAVAADKETFHEVTDGERAEPPVAVARVEDSGRYVLTIDDERYDGGALDLDLFVEKPPRPRHEPGAEPRQLAVTTLQPRWRQTENDILAVWEYAIPNRYWCHLLALFGIWTISGQITTCDDKSPIPGAVVSAFDADWLQDDPLGTATTDATGHYVLTYLASDFRRTPFSPFINVELTEGPDVYVTVELGGQPIITETQWDGRQPGRQNVGHCFCLDLCTDKLVGDPETVPHWQQVEVFDIHPGNGQPGSTFDALGYADPSGGAYVFGGTVTLRGNCPLTDLGTGHPLKYRFLVGEYTWTSGEDPANPPTVAPATLTPVTSQWAPTHVGYVFYTDGNGAAQSASVFVSASDADADGFVQVDGTAVTVPMYNPPGSTAVVTVSGSNFLRTFDLQELNTAAITALHPTKKPGGLPKAQAGETLPAGEQEPVRRYRVGFEVRDAVTDTTLHTDQLDSIIFDSSAVIATLDLEELRLNGCNPLSGATTIHLLHTVDHPHLKTFSVTINNNGGTVHVPPQTPSGAFVVGDYSFRGGASGPHNSTSTGGIPIDVSADPACAYSVNLSWVTRRYLDTGQTIQRLYCH